MNRARSPGVDSKLEVPKRVWCKKYGDDQGGPA